MAHVDRRFGPGRKFGTSTKFGASSWTDGSQLGWAVEVDWDGDGFFDGSSEAYRMSGIRVTRGRPRLVKIDGSGFESLATGQASITLENYDGRYDAWNTASPLYPNVTIGRDVKIRVRDLATGTIYSVFYGLLNDIVPVNNADGTRYVVLDVVDAWQFLRNQTASVAAQSTITVDAAIGKLLDAVSWPTRWGRSLDATEDYLTFWAGSSDKKAATSIEELVSSYFGYFFVTATGQARYIQRADIASPVLNLDQSQLLKDFSIAQPWENLRTITRVKVYPYSLQASAYVYLLQSGGGSTPPVVAPNGGTLTVWGSYTYNGDACHAMSVTMADFAGGGFDFRENADGTGDNLSSSCTITFTDFGDTCKIDIVNNHATKPAYVWALRVRGLPVIVGATTEARYTAAGSVTMPRELVFDNPWLEDYSAALDMANILGPFFATARKFPVIQLESQPALQFVPDLFDLITLTSSTLGLSSESLRVGQITLESVDESCQVMRSTWVLEPYPFTGTWWLWDTRSVFDTSTVFGA